MKNVNSGVFLITGAAGLIGSEISKVLAGSYERLALVDINTEKLQTLRDEISTAYPDRKIKIYNDIDLISESSVEKALEQIESELGNIEALVNCAYPKSQNWHMRFEDIALDDWRESIDKHITSSFLISQRCARRMMVRKSGNILLFSSIYGLNGPDFSIYSETPGMTMPAAYSMIKGGISNFTKYLASYLAPHGVRVNAICPGGIENGQAPQFISAYNKRVPLGRMGRAQEIAGAVEFLLSAQSSYITGVNLPVDGGWTAI